MAMKEACARETTQREKAKVRNQREKLSSTENGSGARKKTPLPNQTTETNKKKKKHTHTHMQTEPTRGIAAARTPTRTRHSRGLQFTGIGPRAAQHSPLALVGQVAGKEARATLYLHTATERGVLKEYKGAGKEKPRE